MRGWQCGRGWMGGSRSLARHWGGGSAVSAAVAVLAVRRYRRRVLEVAGAAWPVVFQRTAPAWRACCPLRAVAHCRAELRPGGGTRGLWTVRDLHTRVGRDGVAQEQRERRQRRQHPARGPLSKGLGGWGAWGVPYRPVVGFSSISANSRARVRLQYDRCGRHFVTVSDCGGFCAGCRSWLRSEAVPAAGQPRRLRT